MDLSRGVPQACYHPRWPEDGCRGESCRTRKRQAVVENGADGVGLFRIEQLYARELPPSEEELFSELQHLVAPLREKPGRSACSTSAAMSDSVLRLPFDGTRW
jgi:hypothetical protein